MIEIDQQRSSALARQMLHEIGCELTLEYCREARRVARELRVRSSRRRRADLPEPDLANEIFCTSATLSRDKNARSADRRGDPARTLRETTTLWQPGVADAARGTWRFRACASVSVHEQFGSPSPSRRHVAFRMRAKYPPVDRGEGALRERQPEPDAKPRSFLDNR